MLQNSSNQQFITTRYISSQLFGSPSTSNPSTLKKSLSQNTNDILAVKYFLPKVCITGHSLVSPLFIVPSKASFSLPTPFNNSFCKSYSLLTLNGLLQHMLPWFQLSFPFPKHLQLRFLFCYILCFLLPVRYTHTHTFLNTYVVQYS